jgi:glutamine amidotransferase
MTADVVVVDYGVGNLFSVRRAFEKCGAEVHLADLPEVIRSAPRLVLPGVGAFADGMRGLIERGLDGAVREFAETGRPMIGICLGMQMLATTSEEFGIHAGLGIIPGQVRPIEKTGIDGQPHKIPHIGWAALQNPGATDWTNSILSDVAPGEAVYMVHSYALMPDNPTHRLADCLYDGRVISAAVRSGNVFGCQFHPEKSGPVGLRILKKFLLT